MVTLWRRCKPWSQPPSVYVAAYFLAIPAFAGLYYVWGDDFYHTTAQFEPALRREERELLNSLADQISKKLIPSAPCPAVSNVNPKLFGTRLTPPDEVIGTLALDNITFTKAGINAPDYATADLLINCVYMGHLNPSTGFRVILDIARVVSIYNEQLPGYEVMLRPFCEMGDANCNALNEALFQLFCANDKTRPSDYRICWPRFHVDDILVTRLRAVGHAKNGFTSTSNTDEWWRMMYLSVVTITTVGYGDVLPLTTWTRTLVGSEAILGIILIGLFFNAVAKK